MPAKPRGKAPAKKRAAQNIGSRLLYSALNVLREVFLLIDRKGVVRFACGAVEDMLGYRPAELVGQPLTLLLVEPETLQTARRARRRPAALDVRVEVRGKSGQTFTAGLLLSPLPTPPPSFSAIASLRDITAELAVESALSARNQHLATLGRVSSLVAEGGDFQALIERLLLITAQTLELRALCVHVLDRASGTARLAVHRGVPRELVVQLSGLSFEPAWLQSALMEAPPPRLAEWPGMSAEGAAALRERPWNDAATAFLLSKGEVFGALTYWGLGPLDADRRALLEAIAAQMALAIEKYQLLHELNESQRKHASLIEGANDGIMISQNGVFRFVNKKMADMLGYTVSDMIGMNIERVMFPDDVDELTARYRQRISGKVPKEIYQARLRTRTGRELPVEFSAVTIDFDGRSASLSFVRDFSERLALQNALIAEKETAELYNDVLTHDVSNLLQTIIGNLDLMGDPAMADSPESREQQREKAMRNARRCAKLIDGVRDLMMIRRLDPASFTPLPLPPMLQEAVEVVREQFRAETFTTVIAAQAHQYVLGHRLATQIFTNLFSNAIRHSTKKDKWVHATVADSADGRCWEVAIEDNGDGIDPEIRRRIFERYARFSQKKGYGLGMSIVKSLVAVLGGAIRIEDRTPGDPTQGTRFVVALPKG